ncbi:hypothetical protein G9A89_008211 [Geosiphon pyriformis]|nr:hypothetical protein G9A89_008211 [Geosiphon pyriformis]
MSTWEQPSAQNPIESAFPLIEETAILQPIGLSNVTKSRMIKLHNTLNFVIFKNSPKFTEIRRNYE